MRLFRWVLALWVASVSGACALSRLGSTDPELALRFGGPGRLALVFERELEGAELDAPASSDEYVSGYAHYAVVYGRGRPWRVPLERVREVRWLSPDDLMVLASSPDDPTGQVRIPYRVDVHERSVSVLGPALEWFNLELSPDRRWIATGVLTSEYGDSEIRIYAADDRQLRDVAFELREDEQHLQVD